jgi:excinuclease UvrABC nuclease subunit
MKPHNLTPIPTHNLAFDTESLGFIQNKNGCYIFTASNGDIVFIGSTNVLKQRIEQHIENNHVFEISAVHFLEIDAVNQASIEKDWLNQFQEVTGSLLPMNI